MRNIAILGLLCTATIGATVFDKGHAADLDPAYPAPAAYGEPDAPFEFGTGWYLRGDVGYSDISRVQPWGDIAKTTSSADWTGDIGAGYRWNSWLRTDLSLNFDGYQHLSANTPSTTCVYNLRVQTTPDGATNTGYFWTPDLGTCTGHDQASLLRTDVMVGGYIDLGTWSGLTPYVGAGVGFARLDTWTSQNYYEDANGQAYKADLTAGGGVPLVWRDTYGAIVTPTVPTTGNPVGFIAQNWSKSTHTTKYNLAWALMGGVAYAVDDHMSIDLGYRYVNLGSYRDASGSNKTVDAQQVRIGLRYAID